MLSIIYLFKKNQSNIVMLVIFAEMFHMFLWSCGIFTQGYHIVRISYWPTPHHLWSWALLSLIGQDCWPTVSVLDISDSLLVKFTCFGSPDGWCRVYSDMGGKNGQDSQFVLTINKALGGFVPNQSTIQRSYIYSQPGFLYIIHLLFQTCISKRRSPFIPF